MKSIYSVILVILTLQSATAQEPNLQEDGTLAGLSPEKSLASIEVPKGYKLELVASEPMVQEPVCFTFDADGAMFVCEWNTYMQDQYATGQKDAVSRIVKLTDTNGDGKMDTRTVFAKGLLLPRSILALHDRVLVRFSQNATIWAYFDDNNDGVSNRKEIAYKAGWAGGNIEHQDNTLIWNSDNKIYGTGQIYSYKAGKLTTEKTPGRYGQWGLTRDDLGRIYGSGNSVPLKNWLNLGGYKLINPPADKSIFDANYSCFVDDYTNPGNRVTATGGQSIIRSSQFGDLKGSLIVPDAARRIVKIVGFEERDGIPFPKSIEQYKDTEFLRSADAYFRPVWTGMGPDGGLYIADMSRGIIQEGQWYPTERTESPNPEWLARYYRAKKWDMFKVIQRGRIYRLIPEASNALEKPIKLSALSSIELVPYLEHENGWWRDTAHKLIVCREDKSVASALRTMLSSKKALARMSAMRCLQAYEALTVKDILNGLADSDEIVRTHAIALSEPYMESNSEVLGALQKLINDSSSTVLLQLHASLSRGESRSILQLRKALVAKHPDNKAVQLSVKSHNSLPRHLAKFASGQKIYNSLCADCHGSGDKGLYVEGKLTAPLFAKNKRLENREYLTKVVLKGLMGPMGKDGSETYADGVMPPLGGTYSDAQIAEVLNYIGFRHGRWKKEMTAEEVGAIREANKARLAPWTFKEAMTPASNTP